MRLVVKPVRSRAERCPRGPCRLFGWVNRTYLDQTDASGHPHGVVAYRYLSRESGSRLGDAFGGRILKRMERIMASLPEGAPPKLVMTVLPRLQDQNDQIIAMLREQNELLRAQRRTA